MREKISHQMFQAKHAEIYLRYYLDKKKIIKSRLSIFILIITAVGVAGWKIEMLPLIACLLATILQFIDRYSKEFVLTDEQLKIFNEMKGKNIQYCSKLEEMYDKLNLDIITEEDAIAMFYSERAMYCEIEGIDDMADVFNNKLLREKSRAETIEYFENNHKLNKNEQERNNEG